jgi:hypothetical protein
LKEETPEALAVLPAAVPQDQPRAHQ